jgi:NAD(P)-dependent dehydrogenase (short-subunit alcohol dehydrogenase family)
MQPFMIHYAASKHAVTGMARAFAAELGRHSIRVNSVHAGAVNTLMGSGDMIASLGRAIETYPQLSHLGGRAGGHRRRLASDESKPVTAAAISIDQGMTQY